MGSRRATGAIVAAVLVAGAAVWWLLGTSDVVGGGTEVLQARPGSERASAGLPDAAGTQAAEPGAVASPATLVTEDATVAASAPPALSITGRILDAHARPLPGAGVLLIADRNDAWQKHWTFLRERPEAVPTHVRSGPDGRFVLGADELPAAATPRLVVHHDDFATLVRPCAGLRAGSLDVGDIPLAPGASVRGRTLDAARAPLAGVDVTFSDLPGGADPRDEDETRLLFSTRKTGADGTFLATGLRPAPATLRAEFRTYKLHLRPVVLRDLRLAAGAPLDVGDLVLEEGGVIAGTVRDDMGAPVAGASVHASKHGDVVTFDEVNGLWRTSAQSDAQGAFRLTGLQPGQYDLASSTRGFAWAYAEDVPLGTPDVRLVMPRYGSLLVLLRDEAGAPVDGATLKATLPRAYKFRSWSDWQFAVESGAAAGLSPGVYRVTGADSRDTELDVRAPGHVPQVVQAPGVGPAQEVEVRVTLRRAAALAGRVVDDLGAPVPAASVAIVHEGQPLTLTGRSGEDGAFVVDGLDAGLWRLRVTAEGHARAEALVVVPAAGAPDPLQVTLERLGAVEGRVTRAGAPQPDARVHAVALPARTREADALQAALGSDDTFEPQRLRTVDADAQGSFHLADVPAGPVLLWVERGADRRWALAWSLQDRKDAALFRVEAEPGETTHAELALPSPATLRGRVLGGGAALEGAPVVLSPADLKAGSMWPFGALEVATDRGGDFEFADVPPGAWILVAQPKGGLLPLAHALELLPGDVRHVELSAQGATLAGLVVDAAGGTPLEGAEVRIGVDLEPETGEAVRLWGGNVLGAARSLSEAMWWSVFTGPDGRFEVRWLPTGRYRLMTTQLGYLEDDRFAALAPSLEPRPERIELVRGARVAGEIAAGGLALLHYEVAYGPPDQPRLRWADVDGTRFVCDGLAPGDWVLTVYAHPDLQQALGSRTVRLGAGQQLDIVLRLDG